MEMNNQLNIFIVDDDKMFARALKEDIETAFGGKKVKVKTFETGETFFQTLNGEKPEVLILDYHLNGNYFDAMDGIEVLKKVKEMLPDTDVIMLSNDDHVDIAMKSMRHGAMDYVVKTATKFKKINYALLNCMRSMETRNELKRYKFIVSATVISVAIIIGGVVAIKMFAPWLL